MSKELNFLFCFIFIYFCGILVPQPGIEPALPAVKVQSLSHWTTREAPQVYFFFFYLPTLSLSHRVHKTVLYISVSFAVLYTGLLLPSF